jgi:hypothetical protein
LLMQERLSALFRRFQARHVLVLLLCILTAAPALGAANRKAVFDHYTTGFPLEGSHTAVACEACHVRGLFKGTPRRCSGCHNGLIAAGRAPEHIATSQPCEVCHDAKSVSWAIVGGFDHRGIVDNCVRCHNGNQAEDKGSNHIASSNLCEACHKGTVSWSSPLTVEHREVRGRCASCHLQDQLRARHIPVPAGMDCDACHDTAPRPFTVVRKFNHALVATLRCDGCHNGGFVSAGATGKTATHIPTPPGIDCRTCHKSTLAWSAAVTVDHTNIVDNCSRCHGVTATGKGPTHIPTPPSVDCSACHRIPPESFATASKFDHRVVSAQRCDACHNGAFTSSGASGKSPNHIATSAGADCSTCHTSTVDWSAAVAVDHTGITNNCARCHGVTATGKGPNHIPTPAGVDCSICHRIPPEPFATASLFDHKSVSTMRCSQCHSGAFDRQGVPGQGTQHIPVPPGRDCNLCHATPPQSFATAALFNHNLVTAQRCDACHNGAFTSAGASGKSPSHVATPAGADCSSCHTSTQDWLSAVTMDHTGITSNCARCHGVTATGKGPNHIPTPAGTDCSVCHRIPPEPFSTASLFNHNFVTSVRCGQCHSGAFAQQGVPGQGSLHIPVPAGRDCDLCHATPPQSFATAALFNHNFVSGQRCDACHNGAFASSGALGKSPSHVTTPAGADCSSCHSSTQDWLAAVTMDHTGISSNCARCHGVTATGKGPNHIPTPAGTDCSACHRVPPEPFVAASLFNHNTVVGIRCSQCHNGSYESQGVPGPGTKHIPTPAGRECDLCHATPPQSFATATRFSHNLVTGMRCDGCHNGAYSGSGALGKSPTHIPTPAGTDCNKCHGSTVDWLAAVTMDHTGISSNCARCHGVTASGKGPNHMPTPAGTDCSICHRIPPEPFALASLFNHNSVLSMRCNQCHNGSYLAQGIPGPSPQHIPMPPGSDCGLCHTAPPQSFATASRFNHFLVTTMRCDGCHNGAYLSSGAQGKSPNHIATPAGADCGSCHGSTVDWASAVTVDHTGITGNCARCHGVTATGKGPNHIPTSAGLDCSACHRIPPEPFAVASLFNHGVVASMLCNQCHNGSFANQGVAGPGPTHIPTPPGSDCRLCHSTPPQTFAFATFSHSVVTAMRCDSCHNGFYTSAGAQGKPADHDPTPAGADCNASGCHTSTTSWD